MRKPTSNFILKSINEQKVLRLIYIEGPISRVEISRRTGLTQQTITNIVKRFLNKKMVLEMGPGENKNGRKPIQLEINDKKIMAIGIEISKKSITAVLMNFRKETIKKVSVELPKGGDATHSMECIFESVDELMTYVPADCEIEGIGCSIQGLVDSKQGIVISSSALSWEHFPLKEKLEARYNMPANLENDVNLIALVENLNGVLHDARHSIVFNFDYGIGSAIAFDKQLHEGASFVAGELGHVKAFFGKDAHPCYCGRKGCLRTLASVRGLEQNSSYTVMQLNDLLDHNDPQALVTLQKIKDAITESIANIIIFFNPDNVLITGSFIQQLKHHLLPDLETQIIESLPQMCKELTFNYLLNNVNHPSMSVSLVMDHFFRIPLDDLSLQLPIKL